jgi:hypothetical protein
MLGSQEAQRGYSGAQRDVAKCSDAKHGVLRIKLYNNVILSTPSFVISLRTYLLLSYNAWWFIVLLIRFE